MNTCIDACACVCVCVCAFLNHNNPLPTPCYPLSRQVCGKRHGITAAVPATLAAARCFCRIKWLKWLMQ